MREYSGTGSVAIAGAETFLKRKLQKAVEWFVSAAFYSSPWFFELFVFERMDIPYKGDRHFPVRVFREQNFKMTQKAFNINYCHVAT